MSRDELLAEDRLIQQRQLKEDISEKLSRVGELKKQLELNGNEAFQAWMIENIRDPFNAAVAGHIDELETNKSFRGKGVLKTYQRVLGWTKRKEEEIRMLQEQIDTAQASMSENTEDNQKPEA